MQRMYRLILSRAPSRVSREFGVFVEPWSAEKGSGFNSLGWRALSEGFLSELL